MTGTEITNFRVGATFNDTEMKLTHYTKSTLIFTFHKDKQNPEL